MLVMDDGKRHYAYPTVGSLWKFRAFNLITVEPDDLGMVNNTVRIPNVEGVQYRRNGSNVGAGGVYEITERTTFDAVPKRGYTFPPGDDYTCRSYSQ